MAPGDASPLPAPSVPLKPRPVVGAFHNGITGCARSLPFNTTPVTASPLRPTTPASGGLPTPAEIASPAGLAAASEAGGFGVAEPDGDDDTDAVAARGLGAAEGVALGEGSDGAVPVGDGTGAAHDPLDDPTTTAMVTTGTTSTRSPRRPATPTVPRANRPDTQTTPRRRAASTARCERFNPPHG